MRGEEGPVFLAIKAKKSWHFLPLFDWKMEEKMERLVTQKELAECLRISTRQVRNLRSDGLFQEAMIERKYDLPKCIAEYIDFKVKAETGRSAKISIEQQKAEHEEIKKRISKLKLRILRRELHEASDVEEFLADMLVRFKGHMISMPSKLAMQVTGETDINKVIQILDREIRDALDELSEYDPDEIDGLKAGSYDAFDDEYDEDDEEGEED